MNAKDLEKLGLSGTEASLYLALLKLGASDVQTLIRETGFYKANTYQALERLIEKGIISKVVEGNRRVYQIQNPHSLIEYVEKKKHEIEIQENVAKKLSAQVKLLKKHTHTPETAIVMRGFAGVKQIYKEIIDQKLDYLAFGSPSESDAIGEHYWQNLHAKQHDTGVKAKMIFHKSLKHWNKIIAIPEVELRFLEEDFEPLTETIIYGSKVALVVWTDKPIVTIIDNPHVADSHRQVFEFIWKASKK
jgi:sugar-specific transcriptional regulator TrmB